jgi:tRNA-dihydrouridine synthase B
MSEHGADLTYVEMLSAVALIHGNRRTLEMLDRHPDETRVGVQVTGRSAEEVAEAVAILDDHNFETIDINMGCPVQKVVKNGCGSAILKDPTRLAETVRLARKATHKPLSIKIRLGWDRTSINAVEVAKIAQNEGADWLTLHGRTRSDDYSTPVDLGWIAAVKKSVTIPVIANGNILNIDSRDQAYSRTAVDGLMVSRGALGCPWIFQMLKGGSTVISLEQWRKTLIRHIDLQFETYGDDAGAAVRLRKHILWYCRGWPGAKTVRDRINKLHSIAEGREIIAEFCQWVGAQGVTELDLQTTDTQSNQMFSWDPKWEMDRQLDRGVGHLS